VTEYVALWCKSNFSFLEGASHPEELVEACAQLGIKGLALTDRDGVYGAVEAHVKARKLGVHLIIGSEITIEDGSNLILLVMNRRGYANLCGLITIGRRRMEKGKSIVSWREICEHAGGLIALWGGDRSLLTGNAEPFFIAHMLRDAFEDRLYALVTRHRRARGPGQEKRLRRRAGHYRLPLLAGMEVLYHHPKRRPLQDVLTCIRHRVKLVDAGCLTKSNAEHALRSPEGFAILYEDDPAPVARTLEVAERCRFSLDDLRYRYPSERLPDGTTTIQWLYRLTMTGAQERYGKEIPLDVVQQLEKELDLIDELDYCGYFLTIWEIVRFCRKNGILCQGRGSAANSAVCYCLGITAVDPVQLGLLFERFLSRERAEPPDIDLDIEHDRREEVIQHVYQKYGRSHAAMVANYIRYRPRSAIREVGKVLGVPETALDRLSKMLSWYGPIPEEALVQAGLDPQQTVYRHMLRLANEIQDFPRHLSIHSGGFLLGHEPVSTLVPIENATMPGRTVIQWDKDSLENLGLFKVDLLGLGALRQLHLGFDLLTAHYGESYSMATIPKEDPRTFDMICKSDTVGVFQIESRAQMSMLPRLKPRRYYDLVIEVSIVRPGPITGGMVHPYLRRREGLEPVVFPHPSLKPVLEKTLGVPLFQEQVIRLAMVAADYTPGEADQLRRDMAAWRRSGRIERHRERLIERMMAKGIAREFAERVFDQIRGFGEYGFPESHAASFALIAYATAWLKCYYPEVFTCALLNAMPMGFYSPATIVADARRHHVEMRPVDIQESHWDCTLESAKEGPYRFAVRMGLRYVKSIGKGDWERIEQARKESRFISADDFAARTDLNDSKLTRLAEAGAFSGFEDNRRAAIWYIKGLAMSPPSSLALKQREKAPVFEDLDSFDTIGWDYQTMAHSVRGHPLAPLRKQLKACQLPDARRVNDMRDGVFVRYAGMVICRQRPGTAGGVVFLTLEDESGFVNVVVWQRVFKAHALRIKTSNFLGVSGKLQNEDGVVHVVAESFWDPHEKIGVRPASGGSRDFH
jgi:error-prone DNA polymerase